MYYSTSLLALVSMAAAVLARTCELGPAETVVSPLNAKAQADFPALPDCEIRGSVVATSDPAGAGVNFALNIANLPVGLGPFSKLHRGYLSNGLVREMLTCKM